MDVYDVEVEAQAETVEEAKQAALEKLGLATDRVEFTIVQEGKRGFLGMGGQPAVITARAKPEKKTRRRSRGSRGKSRGQRKDKNRSAAPEGGSREQRGGSSKMQKPANEGSRSRGNADRSKPKKTPTAGIDEQATVAVEFISGLLEAFGLEGEVKTKIDEDVLIVDVVGDQTEALVGSRGVVMQSVLELTRTVIQRRTFGAPRMRLDIAGYGARRREALTIYASKLADKVLAEGGEVMLEPMHPGDRKVVHDTVSGIEGVRSFSEGEDPHRSIVIAPAE